MEIKHLNIKVSGFVQGVFFRATAEKEAAKLEIKGFVRNEPNGSVYIEAEGEDSKLNEFVKWCRDGSEEAKVENIEISEGPLKNFSSFQRDFADY